MDKYNLLEIIFLIAFLILSIIDAVTTHKIISDGGSELNPVVWFFIKTLGLTLGLVAIKGLVIGFIFWLNPPIIFTGGLVIIYIYVCLHNVRQLA